jgi:hypothetical protein
MGTVEFSKSYFEKADEEQAFKDYAPFRYGTVKREPADEERIRLRRDLDPILVDIVDGGIEAAIVEAERRWREPPAPPSFASSTTIARR